MTKRLVVIAALIALPPTFALGKNGGYGVDYPSVSKPLHDKENEASHPTKPHEAVSSATPFAVGFGIGANFPDMFPFAAYLKYKHTIDLRLFASPVMPFKVRVQMPEDEIKTQKGSPVVIRTPATEISFDANYGPQYGLETLYHPFDGSFFVSFGLSVRSLSLKGDVETNVNIATVDGAYNGDSFTRLYLAANAKTSQAVMRSALGWRWPIYNTGFFSFLMGYTKPYHHHSNVKMQSELHTGSTPIDETLNIALADLKKKKETDLEAQSLKAMRPVERLALPVIGVEMGFFL